MISNEREVEKVVQDVIEQIEKRGKMEEEKLVNFRRQNSHEKPKRIETTEAESAIIKEEEYTNSESENKERVGT